MYIVAYMKDYQNLGCFGQLEHTFFTTPFVVQSIPTCYSFPLLNLVGQLLFYLSPLSLLLHFFIPFSPFYYYSLLFPQNSPIALLISLLSTSLFQFLFWSLHLSLLLSLPPVCQFLILHITAFFFFLLSLQPRLFFMLTVFFFLPPSKCFPFLFSFLSCRSSRRSRKPWQRSITQYFKCYNLLIN